jgi:hypothetical protein
MSESFFSVPEANINSLNAKKAVLLLHKMLHAEARRIRLNPAEISVPFNVDQSDGGIDAQIKNAVQTHSSGIIYNGTTYYQVKSGKNITFTESGLQDIICAEKKRGVKDRKLKPRIRKIAEDDGTLVLFLTGKSAPDRDTAEGYTLKIIKKEIPRTKLVVKIVQFDNIDDLLEPFLSIRLWLLGSVGFQGMTYEEWTDTPVMANSFQDEEARNKTIQNIRTLVESNDPDNQSIRVSGFPGNGKTRSVLQALASNNLASLVIYFQKPSDALETGKLLEIGVRNGIEAIVVIDECDGLSLAQATQILSSSKARVKLVTIFNESSGEIASVKYVDIGETEKLSDDSIVKIIVHEGIPLDTAKRWSEYCDGSPRAALLIAENLKKNPDDLTKNPSHDLAMERYLANSEDLGSQTFADRKTVITWLSLFKRFGWDKKYANERKFILYKVIEKTKFSEEQIERVIKDLKGRKILQGDKTLYISPRILHIRAWIWWWELYKPTFDFKEFQTTVLPDGENIRLEGEMFDWFTGMLEYADNSAGASAVIMELLAVDGPLGNDENLTEALRGNFFLSLTKANPESALRRLDQWFAAKTDDQLRSLTFDRQNTVWSLEIMAAKKDLFVEAARLLLRLARTEDNHTYSNNSEGAFVGLFSNGYGNVAPSEASPEERFIIIEEAMASKTDTEKLLGLGAINQALEADYFTRISGAEYHGLKKANLWRPESWQELADAYSRPWKLLVKVMPDLQRNPRKTAQDIISNRLRGLLKIALVSNEILNDYEQLLEKNVISYEDAIKTLSLILRYETANLPSDVANQLKTLYENLEGNDLPSMMKRYVATNFGEDWWSKDPSVAEAKIQSIARQIVAEPQRLISEELQWLYTNEAQNGFRFGKTLGDIDAKLELLEGIFSTQIAVFAKTKEASIFFFSGYLLSVYNRDIARWRNLLGRIEAQEHLKDYLIEMIWRTGLDDFAGELVLKQLEAGNKQKINLVIFKMGSAVKELSNPVFIKWIEYLLDQKDLLSHATAVSLFMSYYIFREKKKMPIELTKRLLTMPSFVEQDVNNIAQDIYWDWEQTAINFLEQYPEESKVLLDYIIDNFGKDRTLFGSLHHEPVHVLNKLISVDQKATWDKVASRLNGSERAHLLAMWLQGPNFIGSNEIGAFTLFNKDLILQWISEDPKKHAPFVAGYIPHDFGFSSDDPSWLEAILNEYGDDKAVRSAINSNFWAEGYSGPSSLHYASKLEDVRRFRALHRQSKNISVWANEYIPSLEKWVEEEKAREERNDYGL